ncbi:MAG: hypothetical protein AAGE52_21935 [Myxococcota bacterium]
MRERLRELSPTLLAGAALAWMVPFTIARTFELWFVPIWDPAIYCILGGLIVAALLLSLDWRSESPCVAFLGAPALVVACVAAVMPLAVGVEWPTAFDVFEGPRVREAYYLQGLALLVAGLAVAFPGANASRQFGVALTAFWLLGSFATIPFRCCWGAVVQMKSAELAAFGPASMGVFRLFFALVAAALALIALRRIPRRQCLRRSQRKLGMIAAWFGLRALVELATILAAADVCTHRATASRVESLAVLVSGLEGVAACLAVAGWLFTFRQNSARWVLPLLLLSASPTCEVSNEFLFTQNPSPVWETVSNFTPVRWAGEGYFVEPFQDDDSPIAILQGGTLHLFRERRSAVVAPTELRWERLADVTILRVLVEEESTFGQLYGIVRQLPPGASVRIVWSTNDLWNATTARRQWAFADRGARALQGRSIRVVDPEECPVSPCLLTTSWGDEFAAEVVHAHESTRIGDWLRTADGETRYALPRSAHGEVRVAWKTIPPRPRRPIFTAPTLWGCALGGILVAFFFCGWVIAQLVRAARLTRRTRPRLGPRRDLLVVPPWVDPALATRRQFDPGHPYRGGDASAVLVADTPTALRELGRRVRAWQVAFRRAAIRGLAIAIVSGGAGALLFLWR